MSCEIDNEIGSKRLESSGFCREALYTHRDLCHVATRPIAEVALLVCVALLHCETLLD